MSVGWSSLLSMPPPDDHLTALIDVLSTSPTSYHAAAAVSGRLQQAGYVEMDEAAEWLAPARRGYVCRDGAVVAWRQPAQWGPRTRVRVLAAHTDSPALKLKPGGSFAREGFQLADVEVYGGPILHTWFDRDLAVAGRLVDSSGQVHLVQTPAFMRVPALAIHLDRAVNTSLEIDAQRDLTAMFGLALAADTGSSWEAHVAGLAGLEVEDVAGHDLFLVPLQPPALMGLEQELLAAYRLDNLLSVHSTLTGLLNARSTDDVQVLALFDHEEVGSATPSGASGPFLAGTLRRLSHAQQFGVDAHLAWLARGCVLSADVTHGVHPNRSDRHDPVVRPRLNGGPVLKWSAQMRYATDAASMADWTRACAAAEVEHQVFVNNNSVPGGSSLGPLLATRLGMRTVDAGVAVLGMHSAREVCGVRDPESLAKVASAFLEGS